MMRLLTIVINSVLLFAAVHKIDTDYSGLIPASFFMISASPSPPALRLHRKKIRL